MPIAKSSKTSLQPIELKGRPSQSGHDKGYTLNYDDSFERLLIEIAQLHRRKAADYASDNDEVKNFRDVVNMVKWEDYDILQDIFTMVARKFCRIRNLWGRGAENESVRDSWLDMAVYSLLGVLYIDGNATHWEDDEDDDDL